MIYNPTFAFNPTLMNDAIRMMASVLGKDINVSDTGQNFAYGMFVAVGNGASESAGAQAFYKLTEAVGHFSRFSGLGDDLRKMFAEAVGDKFDRVIHALDTLSHVQADYAPPFDDHPQARLADADVRDRVRRLANGGVTEFAFEAMTPAPGDSTPLDAYRSLGQRFLYVTRSQQQTPDGKPCYSLFDPERGNFANLSEDEVLASIGESRAALTASIDGEMKRQHDGIQFDAIGVRDVTGQSLDLTAPGLMDELKSAVDDVTQFAREGAEFVTTDTRRSMDGRDVTIGYVWCMHANRFDIRVGVDTHPVAGQPPHFEWLGDIYEVAGNSHFDKREVESKVFERIGLTPIDTSTVIPFLPAHGDDIEVTPRIAETLDTNASPKVHQFVQWLSVFGTPGAGIDGAAIRLDPVPGPPTLLVATR
ncbi:hypothetical protein ACPWR0_07605 [Pandoraea pneumonica]|uniref:hypothetical protein n=1 Tax=Pandoraea pneumonica TaxID=2508299 RepID=UPI003CF322EF